MLCWDWKSFYGPGHGVGDGAVDVATLTAALNNGSASFTAIHREHLGPKKDFLYLRIFPRKPVKSAFTIILWTYTFYRLILKLT